MAQAPVMRGMLHSYGRRAIAVSLVTSVSVTAAFFFGYVQPRHNRYEEFFRTYDPYTRMKEICAQNKGYMHTCPDELAKLYEEKGKPIASR